MWKLIESAEKVISSSLFKAGTEYGKLCVLVRDRILGPTLKQCVTFHVYSKIQTILHLRKMQNRDFCEKILPISTIYFSAHIPVTVTVYRYPVSLMSGIVIHYLSVIQYLSYPVSCRISILLYYWALKYQVSVQHGLSMVCIHV